MGKYFCRTCKLEFEAEQDRCPECLKTSTVRPGGAGAGADGKRDPYSLMKGPGILVTMAVIVPFMLIDYRRPWWQTFLIAMLGFGAGHMVDRLWRTRGTRKAKKN